MTSSRSGNVLWSHIEPLPEFEGVAQHVAGVLSTVTHCGFDALASAPEVSEETLALYFRICGPGEADKLSDVLQIARDLTIKEPGFGPGWAQVALMTGQTIATGQATDVPAMRDEGLRAARTALKLDPELANAWVAMSLLVPLDHLAEREKYLKLALKATAAGM